MIEILNHTILTKFPLFIAGNENAGTALGGIIFTSWIGAGVSRLHLVQSQRRQKKYKKNGLDVTTWWSLGYYQPWNQRLLQVGFNAIHKGALGWNSEDIWWDKCSTFVQPQERTVQKDNMRVVVYYCKVKELWDQITKLEKMPDYKVWCDGEMHFQCVKENAGHTSNK